MAVDPLKALARLESLKSIKSQFDAHHEEVRKVTYPSATEFTSQMIRGQKLHKDVFDGSAELTSEMCASALFGMVTNPATKWMGLATQDRSLMEIEENALWLEDSTVRMLAMFNSPRVNFATQQYLKLQNFVAFGTAPQFIAELPGGIPLFQTAALAQCYVAEGDDGRINTVYRLYERTADQLYTRFANRLPRQVIEKAQDPKKMDEMVQCLHLVEPRPRGDRKPGAVDVVNKPYREAYIIVDQKELVRESGYDENPWICPRMNPRPGEIYGRGRGMTALADTKMLQRSMKSTIRAAEKRTDPSYQVPDDGIMSPLRMTPSGINVVRADFFQYQGGAIRPIESGADPKLGEEFNESIRRRIDRAHWIPILEAFTDPKMTATQVLKLDEQTLRFVGPIIGRMQSEDLGPMIDRVFPIMLRGGRFRPVPPGLDGAALEVEYVSPIAKAQRLEEARGIAETFEILAPLLGEGSDVWDNIDGDAAFRAVAQLRNVPKNVLRDRKAVAKIREARSEASQARAQADTMIEGAPAAAKLLQALSAAGAAPARAA